MLNVAGDPKQELPQARTSHFDNIPLQDRNGTKYHERFGALPATPYEAGIASTLAWFRNHADAHNAN